MKIDKRSVDALKPGDQLTDSQTIGFRARCLPSGKVTFSFRYRDRATGKRHELPLGMHGTVTVDQARRQAMQQAGDVVGGANPAAERKVAIARSENTVNFVLDEWLVHARRKKLRSADKVARYLDRHIRPAIGETVIYDLGRSDVAAMLTKIATTAPVQANRVRAHLNAALNWWRDRDDKFVTMPVPGKKLLGKEESRDRALDELEIRDVWLALDQLEDGSTFPALVRTLLLTACRRDEVANMHTREIDGDVWTIPAERYKTGVEHVTPLVPAIKALLPNRDDGFVFASKGFEAPFSGFSKAKRLLDAAIAARRKSEGRKPMPAWRLHDLRRTARTHMARLGIADQVAERLLGHKASGISAVYNRHDYLAEKTEALTRWAKYVNGVVHPSPAKVVPLSTAKRRNVGR
jgi:integrase